MSVIDDKINALIQFKSSIKDTVERVIIDNKEFIIDMNATIQLYERGITSEGVEIDTYRPYTARTISIKRSKGQPVDRVTLRDTGDFQDSMNITFFEGGFRFWSTDQKTLDLVRKYGEKIFGLTEEHVNELIDEYIRPVLEAQRDILL